MVLVQSLLTQKAKPNKVSTVDVVIPCYNYGKYLRNCVQSVLSQSGVDVRVLVIDDASPDDTAEIGKMLEASDNRVEFRRHKQNKGHIATYNEGLIDWSTSDYTVLLSADDMLTRGSLNRAVTIMDEDKNVGMVYGRAVHFYEGNGIPKVAEERWSYTRFSGFEWLEGRCRAGHNVITSPEVVVRRSVQQLVGGYRRELPHTGDLEMWLRIAAVADIAYVRGAPQALYRVHPASMIRTKYNSSFVDIQERKAAFDSFFHEHQGCIADLERLRNLVCRALARESLWDACRAYDHNRVEVARATELVEFAKNIYEQASFLPEYSALRRRQFLGPKICNRTQLFICSAVVRRLEHWRRRQHWKKYGI